MTAHEQEIAKRISQAWRSNEQLNGAVKLKFRLTKDGEAYYISIVSGYSDPDLIQAALHATLFGMPFNLPEDNLPQQSEVVCNLQCQFGKVNVDVQESSLPLSDIQDAKGALQKVPYGNEKYKNDSRMRGWMWERVFALAECLDDFPESAEIQNEMARAMSPLGLDRDKAHDWISLGRACETEIPIMRNPSPGAVKDCKKRIASLFRAWRLHHDNNTLAELENAYSRKLACQVLAESKADPLLLGVAAELTEQFDTAREQYEQARKKGSASANELLGRMRGATITGAQLRRLTIADSLMPRRQRSDWEQVLHWFPIDTEMILVSSGPFRMEGPEDPGKTDYDHFSAKEKLRAMNVPAPAVTQSEAMKALQHAYIAIAVEGGRAFEQPSGIGVGSMQGATVLILAQESDETARKVIDALRPAAHRRFLDEGVEILGFNEKVDESASSRVSYVCEPASGVLVTATNMQFLHEILQRMQISDNERALPNELPEWKHVDTTADIWAVRHYDKGHMPFDRSALIELIAEAEASNWKVGDYTIMDKDAIGVVVSSTPDDKFVVTFLSDNPSALAARADYWRRAFSPREPAAVSEGGKPAQSDNRIAISTLNSAATITAPAKGKEATIVWLLVLDATGHMVNI